MYQKDEFKKLDDKYTTHLYTGLYGFAMRYCHRQLENFNREKKYTKVLEIGAGNAPHLNYLKHDYDEYFIVETSSYALEFYKEMKNVKAYSYDGVNIYPLDDYKELKGKKSTILEKVFSIYCKDEFGKIIKILKNIK